MARQKCRLDWNGEFFFQGADHPQHFQFCFSRQSVSAFDFDGPRAGSDRLLQSVAGIGEQIGFGHRRSARAEFRIPPPSRQFLGSFAFKAAQEFSGTAGRKHQVGVAVAPSRQRVFACSPPLQSAPIGNTWKRVHGPEVHNDSVFNGQPRLLEHRQGAHLSAFKYGGGASYAPTNPDVLPEHSHGRKVAIPARVP